MKIIMFMVGLFIFFTGCDSKSEQGLKELQNGNYIKALNKWEKGCENTDYESCYNLGFMYFQGDGVKKDLNKSLYYYNIACDHKIALACQNIAILYDTSLIKNTDLAIKYYDKACTLNASKSCIKLGGYYDYPKGSSLTRNRAIAKKLYKKGCDGGIKDGCKYYKELLKLGY